ncbi:hypothetical protein [Lysobacter niastensis]|uniref:Lysozyme inhibitor LprI N-terminal domain-containing protein n=1 Tax=Lysobacter niastensis TaxID=380629 RepID=A0ABS0B3K7_9GAMM|nr:hypothetical protein [Lysobacter niastensis]MBF6023061.1 hypothetical protein [Lysobacter niastensis]
MKIGVFVLSLLLMSTAAMASVDRSVLLIDDIKTEQAKIRVDVESRKAPYDDLSASERSELLAKQSRMLNMLDGKQSTDELNEQQKTEVFNTLEWIESVANNSADERIVCERRAILGSTRKERICKTAGQWREEREAARNMMDAGGICSDCKNN